MDTKTTQNNSKNIETTNDQKESNDPTSSIELEEIAADTFFSNIPVVSANIFDDPKPAQIRTIPKISVSNPELLPRNVSVASDLGSIPASRDDLKMITTQDANFVHRYVRSPELITLQQVEEFLKSGRANMENALMREYDKLREKIGKIIFVVDCILVVITIAKWIYLGIAMPGGKDFWGIFGFLLWFSMEFAYRWPGYLRKYPGIYMNGILHLADVTMNLIYFIPYTNSLTLLDIFWLNIPTMIHSVFVFSSLYYIHHVIWIDESLAAHMFFHEKSSAQSIMQKISQKKKYRRISFGWKSILWVNALLIIEYINIMQGYYSYALNYQSYVKYAYLCLAVVEQLLLPIVFSVFASHMLVPWNIENKKQNLYLISAKRSKIIIWLRRYFVDWLSTKFLLVVSNFITDFFYLVLKIIDWTYVSQHGTAIAFFVFSILKIVQLFGNILIVFLAWAVPKIVRKREEKTV